MSAHLRPQTSDALRPCRYASRIIAQSRMERARAALSTARTSSGERNAIVERLVLRGALGMTENLRNGTTCCTFCKATLHLLCATWLGARSVLDTPARPTVSQRCLFVFAFRG